MKILSILEDAKLTVVTLKLLKRDFPLESPKQTTCISCICTIWHCGYLLHKGFIFSPSGRDLEAFDCSRVNHPLYTSISGLNAWVPGLCLMNIFQQMPNF